MVRKLSYLLLASATAVSFSARSPEATRSSRRGKATRLSLRESSQSQAQSPDVVKQAQEKLSAAGMDAGQADGELGPKTQAAVKDFQQSKGDPGVGSA